MRSGSEPRQQRPFIVQGYCIVRDAGHVFAVAMTLVLLPAIAFASLPDPVWIAGIYSLADGDDVVTLIAEQAAPDSGVVEHVSPLRCLLKTCLELELVHVRGVRTGRHTRGPPRGPYPAALVPPSICCSFVVCRSTPFLPQSDKSETAIARFATKNPVDGLTRRCSGCRAR
jgi:hypothetical protein